MYSVWKIFCLLLWLLPLQRCAIIKRTGSKFVGAEDDVGQVPVKYCDSVPEVILSAVLGPAFNARYMAIDDPTRIPADPEDEQPGQVKRKIGKIPSFAVEEEFNSAFSNDPAWDVEFANQDHEVRDGSITDRSLRHVKSAPWQCESDIQWIDLGKDYFPRFLRTVECSKCSCWYGHYVCKPRSFTVKLLKRRSGICVPSPSVDELKSPSKYGVAGLPRELRELWVWEERAVNFCCECSPGP